MVDPHQPVESASLDRLIFELHQALGPSGDGPGDCARLLRAIPAAVLTEPTREAILQALSAADARSARGGFHPGLLDLLADADSSEGLQAYLLHDTLILEFTTTITHQPLAQLHIPWQTPPTTLGSCTLLTIAVQEEPADEGAQALCAQALGIHPHQLHLVGTRSSLKGLPIWEFSDGGSSHYLWIGGSKPLDAYDAAWLLGLLCCRAKIDYAVRAAADAFTQGRQHYQEIEDRLRQISATPIGPADRQQRITLLEEHLRVLPHHSYRLAGCERDLEAHLLTLQDNVANARLHCSHLLQDDDTFLRHDYLAEQCAIHERQIQHDLKVLQPGRRYADQAIEAIRTMVTLDSQKQQLELEQKENTRELNQRKTLAIVGSGLTISGLAASSRPRPSQKLFASSPTPPTIPTSAGLWLADIGIHAGLGLVTASLVYLAWTIVGRLRSRPENRNAGAPGRPWVR